MELYVFTWSPPMTTDRLTCTLQILLFEDLDVIRDFQAQIPRFAWHLTQFSEQNNAIAAFNLWTALHLEGLGCNLQHINPTIDQRLIGLWDISPQWSLKAQLVFGSPTAEPHEKEFAPVKGRLFVHGVGAKVSLFECL